jgi:hypothetical protein
MNIQYNYGNPSEVDVAVTSGNITTNTIDYPIFSTFLTDVGGALNASGCLEGAWNINGDYDIGTGSGQQRFWIAPPVGELYYVSRMIVNVEDSGTFDSGKYGNNVVLDNGIKVNAKHESGQKETLLTGQKTIQKNVDWGGVCYDVVYQAFGQGNNFLSVRWTFSKAGRPLKLDGDTGDYLEVVVSDDMTGLVGHLFLVQGIVQIK